MSAVLEVEAVNSGFEESAALIKREAQALAIINQATYDVAAEKFKAAADLERQIVDHYKPLKEKAHAAHKAICDAEKTMLTPVQAAKREFSRAIGAWDAEQERIRREEQRKAEEEARRRATEEAEKLALDAIDHGATEEEINSIVEEAVTAPLPAVHVAPTYTRAAGVVTRETWHAELISLPLLIKAAAENPAAFGQYLTVNMSAANAAARSQKSAFRVPGLIAKSDRAAAKGR